MDKQQAARIVERLADGLHPETGQPMQHPGILNQPEVIRALNLAARTLGGTAKSIPSGKITLNHGKAWDKAEEQRLLSGWDQRKSMRELAAIHGRTLGAIRSRLILHGKITL
jgi:hypothetical protein